MMSTVIAIALANTRSLARDRMTSIAARIDRS
jgi:hypothetical protein